MIMKEELLTDLEIVKMERRMRIERSRWLNLNAIAD